MLHAWTSPFSAGGAFVTIADDGTASDVLRRHFYDPQKEILLIVTVHTDPQEILLIVTVHTDPQEILLIVTVHTDAQEILLVVTDCPH